MNALGRSVAKPLAEATTPRARALSQGADEAKQRRSLLAA
jgi:hypothetical protein